MLWPAVTYDWSLASTAYEETTIRNYDADFTIDEDGDLHARRDAHHRLPRLRQARHLPLLRRGRPEPDQRPPGPARHLGDARRVAGAVRDPRRGERPDHQRQDRQRRRLHRRGRPHLRHRVHHRRRARGGHDRRGDPVLLEPDPGRLAPVDRRRPPHREPARRGPGRAVCPRGRPDRRLYGGGRRHRDPHRRRRVAVAQHSRDREGRPRHADARARHHRAVGTRGSTRCSAAARPSSPSCSCWPCWPEPSARGRRAR